MVCTLAPTNRTAISIITTRQPDTISYTQTRVYNIVNFTFLSISHEQYSPCCVTSYWQCHTDTMMCDIILTMSHWHHAVWHHTGSYNYVKQTGFGVPAISLYFWPETLFIRLITWTYCLHFWKLYRFIICICCFWIKYILFICTVIYMQISRLYNAGSP